MDTRKVAVITGASQGIGAGLVEGYLDLGYAVIANSRSIAPRDDDSLVTVAGDISDPEVADRIIATALDRFGRVDALVNNAGIFIAKPFTDYSPEDFGTAVAINLGGFFHITQRAIARMADQGSGHVVNVSTSLVDHPDRERPSALAVLTKGGLEAATRALAIEYAPRGLRVNAVSLGVIKTPAHDPESYAGMETLNPLGRLGEVGDVAAGILYLERATFVTGTILHIDGGR